MEITLNQNEESNTAKGWLLSIGIHAGIVALLLFSIVFKPQIPPPPEYGMEVNFGYDEQGFGEEQSMTPPGEKPNEAVSNQQVTDPEEQQAKQTEEEPAPEEKLITSEEDNSVAIQNSEKPKEAAKTVENPKPADVTKPSTSKPSNTSLYPTNTGKDGGGSNNGNKPGTVGDMGKPNGNPDVRGIYDGNGGKGSGSLDMAGWRWDSKPKVNDDSNEEGKIVFQIKVDEEGNIIAVNVLEKTVSSSLVQKYRKEVEDLTFSRSGGGSTGEGATGRVTFIITSK